MRPVPVPAQLPPAVAGFAGRLQELVRLDAALAQAERERSAGSVAVVISAVSGTAGVGKTALALQWAHQVASRFPDGQLYVNLRGFGPDGQPAEPSEAIRGFLDALGVPEAAIPAGVQAQAALYRSLLAGKRVLVVVDNARDAEQVRPLLPGSPACLVIVTSRSDLAGLVAAEGAFPVNLELLTPAEASDLLARRLGEAPGGQRAGSGGGDHRPVRAAAAGTGHRRGPRGRAGPAFPLATIAAELRDATGALDPFAGADPATDVRAVFSWSCQALSEDAARLFRLLGLHPGPDIGAHAAASLAGARRRKGRPAPGRTDRGQPAARIRPGRYSLHDLLRAYATELAHSHDDEQQRQAARHRVLDHYLHAAHAAALLPHRSRTLIPIAPAQPGVITSAWSTPRRRWPGSPPSTARCSP